MNFFFYTFCQTVIRKREKKKRKESFIDEESIHVNLNFFFLTSVRNKPWWRPKRPGPPKSIFYIVIIYFIFIVGPHFQNLWPPFFPIILTSLTQIEIIQPKILTKIIKTFTMVIVFQQKKNYFTTKEPKNHVLLEKLKLNIFVTTILVDYSKLLKIKYNILLKLYIFLQLKNSNSLSSFFILMSCIYYFK